MNIRIGELISYERLAGVNDRQSVMDMLKDITYRLGEGVPYESQTPTVKRPRRAPEPKSPT